MMTRNSFIWLALVALAPGAAVQGQTGAACTYEQCGLGIAPVWNGLAVVRGAQRTNVGVLGFFLPHDVSGAFTGSDSGRVFARRALHVRRAGAVLTDLGGLLLAGGAAIAIRDGRLTPRSNGLGIAGGGLLTLSVPAQFIADGHLSQAVWWYNLQFTRRP